MNPPHFKSHLKNGASIIIAQRQNAKVPLTLTEFAQVDLFGS